MSERKQEQDERMDGAKEGQSGGVREGTEPGRQGQEDGGQGPQSPAGASDRPGPRMRTVDRSQPLPVITIDQLIPDDHPARDVWRFCQSLDLSELYDRIGSRQSGAGRPPFDPRILIALWLYATLAGVTTASQLADLVVEHNSFRWLAGNLSISAHTLSDFRVRDVDLLEDLLKHSVNVLREQGLIDLERVAQDGIRVRASAGAASFRRRARLETLFQEAKDKLAALKAQMAAEAANPIDPQTKTPSAKKRAAQLHQASKRVARLKAALDRLAQLEAKQAGQKTAKDKAGAQQTDTEPGKAAQGQTPISAGEQGKVEQPQTVQPEAEQNKDKKSAEQTKAQKKRAKKKAARQRAAAAKKAKAQQAKAKKEAKKKAKQEKENEPRVSTSDPEATRMKMANGGFNPAYNIQYNTTCNGQVVVGVEVSMEGHDHGKLSPMLNKVEATYGETPKEGYVDGGFVSEKEIEKVQGEIGSKVYAPVPKPRKEGQDRFAPRDKDSKEAAEWRARMGTDEAKELYKLRAATAECVNAQARNRGLVLLTVRGLRKVKAIALWFAIAHNVARAVSLAAAVALHVS